MDAPSDARASGGDADEVTRGEMEDEFIRIINNQLGLIDYFDCYLKSYITNGKDYGGVLSKVQRRIEAFKGWLEGAKACRCDVSDKEEPACWELTVTRQEQLKFVVKGPDNGSSVEIEARDHEEADSMKVVFDDVSLWSSHFVAAERDLIKMIQLQAEKEARQIYDSQLGAARDRHTGLIQELNETRDAVQRMMGSIAMMRAVLVRTLYDGRYGVTRNDTY